MKPTHVPLPLPLRHFPLRVLSAVRSLLSFARSSTPHHPPCTGANDAATGCMSASHFCGLPCTESNAWEVHQCAPGFSLEIHELQFCADFYNAHHACCWPRLLLDTHLGRAAAEMKAAGTSSAAAERVTFYTDHIATVADQMFAAQQATLPRAPSVRRVLFHDSVPPVLRCHAQSDGGVYVLRGQLRLRHRCVLPLSSPLPPQTAEQQGTHEAAPACTHGATADALARDVFPLVLVMAPSETCASHVDADPPTASAATAWRAKPLVLALQSVTQEPPTAAGTQSSDTTPGTQQGLGQRTAEWCARYTPFLWVCNPAGNQCRSPASRGGPSKGRGRQLKDAQGDGATSLTPLRLSFTVHASQYTSASARLRVLEAIESGDTYSLHVTKRVRFSLAAPEVYERAVLGAEREALNQARGRRTRQLMRFFDHTARGPGGGATPEHPKRRRTESMAAGLSPASSDTPTQSCRGVPLVTTSLVGHLGTAHAIRCEWCRLPRATTLASVLAPRSASRVDAATADAASTAESSSPWPLRLQAPLANRSGAVVELSSLDTLQRLSTALRSIVDSSTRPV